MDRTLKDLRKRSRALAAMPGFNPWLLLGRLYWRWWLASFIFLSLFALFNFGFNWSVSRSNLAAYFPAVVVLVITLSTPRLLRARFKNARESFRSLLSACRPYLLAIAAFGVLLAGFEIVLGWTLQKSTLVAAYFAIAVLAVTLNTKAVKDIGRDIPRTE